jgi:hypothetical protein
MKQFFLAAIVLSLAAAPIAQAVDAIKLAVDAGAVRLACIQNADGGWEFDVTGAPCLSGPGPSPSNTFGVTARGMLDAFILTHKAAFKASAVATGDALKTQQLTHAACATPADRPVTANLLFMVELSKKAGSSYKTAAKKDSTDSKPAAKTAEPESSTKPQASTRTASWAGECCRSLVIFSATCSVVDSETIALPSVEGAKALSQVP